MNYNASEQDIFDMPLKHYGVKGMKWDKKKQKLIEETRRKSDWVVDMRGKDATIENIKKEELKIAKRVLRRGIKKAATKKIKKPTAFEKELAKAKRGEQTNKYKKRQEYKDVARTMRDYAKTKEVKKKNDSFIRKIKDKVKGKELKGLGDYLDQRFKGKDKERLSMIAKIVNQANKPLRQKPEPPRKKRKK